MKNLTPAMRQYYETKNQYPDALIFFRMGDFYEFFGEDAKLVSEELDITLTTRGRSKDGSAMPLAGIPYHSIDTYLPRLIKKGYKVAICEQLEDPKQAKGVVKRGVVRIITPGTAIDTSILTDASNNYLMVISGSISKSKDKTKIDPDDVYSFGLAFLDISTGDFSTCQFEDSTPFERVISEAAGIQPSECIVQSSLENLTVLIDRLKELDIKIEFRDFGNGSSDLDSAKKTLTEQFGVETLDGFGFSGKAEIISCGEALNYAFETQMRELNHIKTVRCYSSADYMVLDSITLRNLEVLKNVHDEKTNFSLYNVLDFTKTAMGKRTLKSWILRPLIDKTEIENRLKAVEFLKNNSLPEYDILNALSDINDIERLIVRAVYGTSNARDLISLKNSLMKIPDIISALSDYDDEEIPKFLSNIINKLSDYNFTEDLVNLISNSIVDDPPVSVREGGMIKKGFNFEVDEYKSISKDSKNRIAAFQEKERKRTGIKSLKVGFNKVFGYFIEVTKANINQVPENYIRKQTMANAERFFTPELKEQEDLILSADEKLVELEYELFIQITQKVCEFTDEIRNISSLLGALDVIVGFSIAASENNYVCPEISDSTEILIRNGRHPIVETALRGTFVPNDTEMDCIENQILLITGPNMAGKSTYMRQIAMIVIMAQVGSFVPASYAKIGIVDRIFTRIGAYDDLTAGRSTFMVEMIELANILNNSTPKSLILLDEIGRGTSTYDGYSIAKASIEYIHDKGKSGTSVTPTKSSTPITLSTSSTPSKSSTPGTSSTSVPSSKSSPSPGVRTLFATHYHQLTILENKLPRLKNYHIAVRESGQDLIFLRKIVPGATDKSYGIHVAKIAGVPDEVISRAKKILDEIESESMIENENPKRSKKRTGVRYTQLMFYDPESDPQYMIKEDSSKFEESKEYENYKKLKDKIDNADINNMTPVDALLFLSEIKEISNE
ncbi:MAG: DNA mismatch repair protein MutS [Methanosarcinaceae archaeon]|nr:DNA mismatch repair protein MutS [Methanosarcinaceae archaeon]